MTIRNEVVREAREWIGTRWQHQARTKGQATDCGGMVYGVGFALGLVPEVSQLPQAERFIGYSRVARDGSMAEACGLLLTRIPKADMQPGDVVLMKFEAEPQHVGILGDYPHDGLLSLIHAYAPMRKVIEHRLDAQWKARIVGAYAFPGIDA